MSSAFRPDLFSTSRPGWEPAEAQLSSAIQPVTAHFAADLLPLNAAPEQSQALGINSSNLRVHTAGGVWLLKRWSRSADRAQAQRTLELMGWLAERGLPVPAPRPFRHGGLLHEEESGLWCLFPFVAGDYFSGGHAELDAVAEMTGRLTSVLSLCPATYLPDRGPEHLTDADDRILERTEQAESRWGEMFGEEYAQLLSDAWPGLRREWLRLRREPPAAGPVHAVHFDLHPHNWLMQDSRVAAALDFEACKLMPVGFAIAFAGLKLCRQAVAAAADPALAPGFGKRFVEGVCGAHAALAPLAGRFADLALAEVLRRLCIILRLNVERNERTWNKVLPVQLGHLSESHLLFH